MNHEGLARRVDLRLRAAYPEIQTVIYKISDQTFLIFCKEVGVFFDNIKKEFDYSIRLIGEDIGITDTIPINFIDIIPAISDTEISKNFEGVSFTKFSLLNLLASKFSNVHFGAIEVQKNEIKIYTESFKEINDNGIQYHFLNKADREKIITFLNNLKIPFNFSLIEQNKDDKSELMGRGINPVHFIHAANLTKKPKEYSLRDEALWFDNVDNIFSGEFKKDKLFFYNPEEYSCYVDYSTFENIDIRNHLFLFQTVYVTPPLNVNKSINLWLQQAKINKDEFLELIKRKRIKIILIQPEYRYDIAFIDEIYEAAPNALITSRAIAALQQIDIVEMSDNYIFNDASSMKEIKIFSDFLAKETKYQAHSLYEILSYPIKARRKSFEVLNDSGLFSAASFGVNNAIEKSISKAANKDLSVEFTINAQAIHLANSLNATYFPYKTKDGYSDLFYANIMGEMLNFYKSANIQNIKSFADNQKKINSGISPINPIDIIEINDYIPILEFEEILSENIFYPKSKKLMEFLASLPNDERNEKIYEYNAAINKKGFFEKNKNIIDLAKNAFMDLAGIFTNFSFLGTSVFLGNSFSKSVPLFKNIWSKIEEAMTQNIDKSNIHYLRKINRVAKIKRKN